MTPVTFNLVLKASTKHGLTIVATVKMLHIVDTNFPTNVCKKWRRSNEADAMSRTFGVVELTLVSFLFTSSFQPLCHVTMNACESFPSLKRPRRWNAFPSITVPAVLFLLIIVLQRLSRAFLRAPPLKCAIVFGLFCQTQKKNLD